MKKLDIFLELIALISVAIFIAIVFYVGFKAVTYNDEVVTIKTVKLIKSE